MALHQQAAAARLAQGIGPGMPGMPPPGMHGLPGLPGLPGMPAPGIPGTHTHTHTSHVPGLMPLVAHTKNSGVCCYCLMKFKKKSRHARADAGYDAARGEFEARPDAAYEKMPPCAHW